MFAALRGIHPYLCTPVLPRGQFRQFFIKIRAVRGPEGSERHLDAARQQLPREQFLPLNCHAIFRLCLIKGAHHGGHATAHFLEGFLEGSLRSVLLRRVLRRHLVRISVGTGVLRRVLRRGA